jgi:hypothetical protein
MTPNLFRRYATMILGVTLATVPGFSKTPISDVRLTIRLYDYVNLPADERRELTANANRILGYTGISVEFLECLADRAENRSPACTAPLRPTDLVLRIFLPKLAVKGEQLGYASQAPEGGAYITVFSHPEQRKSRVGGLSDGAFLGHAVAHEIGHLLLGANSHSSSGIMRPVWRLIDEEWMAKGVLIFDGGQAGKMRASMLDRTGRKATGG